MFLSILEILRSFYRMESRERIKTLKTSFRMPHNVLFQLSFFCFLLFVFLGVFFEGERSERMGGGGISRQTVILFSYSFLCFTAWVLIIDNSWVAVFNMLATSKPCGKICFFFDQHYLPGKIISQVLAC